MTFFRTFGLISLPIFLCSCVNSGGYFQNDGPPSSVWGEQDFSHAPNAIPRVETPHKAANRPYTINGVRYKPITGDAPFQQTGIASWYGKQFHGNKTSIGETYNMFAMTAAHTTMQLPSYAKVTNLENGKSVIVRVNDRGPFLNNRIIDLSYAAASKLGYVQKGTAKVKVERIRNADIRNGTSTQSTNIEMVEVMNTQEEKQADMVALASILGDTVTQHSEANQHPVSTQNVSTTQEPIIVEPSTTSGVTIDDTHESQLTSDQNGAINLTDLAKQDNLVSTEGITTTQSNSVTSYSNWAIQAGVFSTKKNALARAEQLKTQINHVIDIFEDKGRYRVLIGNFENRLIASEQAQALSNLLNEKLIPFEKQ